MLPTVCKTFELDSIKKKSISKKSTNCIVMNNDTQTIMLSGLVRDFFKYTCYHIYKRFILKCIQNIITEQLCVNIMILT